MGSGDLGESRFEKPAYTGQRNNHIPIQAFKRIPLTSDKNFNVGQVVIIDKNPQNGIQGDLYYLARFDQTNGNAIWLKLVGQVAALEPILTIEAEDGNQVPANVAGNILIGGLGGISTNGSINTNEIFISSDAIREIHTDAGQPVKADLQGVLNIEGQGIISTSSDVNSNKVIISASAITSAVESIVGGNGGNPLVGNVEVFATRGNVISNNFNQIVIEIDDQGGIVRAYGDDNAYIEKNGLDSVYILGQPNSGISTQVNPATSTLFISADVVKEIITPSGTVGSDLNNTVTFAEGSGIQISSAGNTITFSSSGGSGGGLSFITGDDSIQVPPDGSNNINFNGGVGLSFSGDVGSNTINLTGNFVLSMQGNSGSAVEAAGNSLSIIGENGVTVVGTQIDSTLRISSDAARSVASDSGTAVALNQAVRVLGGQNCSTSASGDAVTINVDNLAAGSVKFLSGNNSIQVPANGVDEIAIIGGNGINVLGNPANSTLTIDSNVDVGVLSLTFNGVQVLPASGGTISLNNGQGITITPNVGSNLATISTAAILSMNGDSGGSANPNASGEFTIEGGSDISVVSDPTNNKLTISSTATPQTAIETVTFDSGGEISPNNGNLNIVTSGNGLSLVGNPATNTGTLSNTLLNSITAPTGGAVFSTANNISFTSSNGVVITGDPNNSTIDFSVTHPNSVLQIQGDSGGDVSPDGNGLLHLIGKVGSGISVEGNAAGNELLIDSTAILQVTPSTGSPVTPVSGNINISAGSGITVNGSGNSVLISSSLASSAIEEIESDTVTPTATPFANKLTIKGGDGISVVNAFGDRGIVISSTNTAGLTWQEQTTSGALSFGTGYFVNHTGGSEITLTLPPTPNIGDRLRVVSMNTGLFRVSAFSQQIRVGNLLSTAISGYVQNFEAGDGLEIIYSGNNVYYACIEQGSFDVV